MREIRWLEGVPIALPSPLLPTGTEYYADNITFNDMENVSRASGRHIQTLEDITVWNLSVATF